MPIAGFLPLLLAARLGVEETAAAREQARICESATGASAVTACQSALSLGLQPERAHAVRRLLGRRLAALARWPDVVALYREDSELRPLDALAQLRLGEAVLFGLGDPRAAEPALRESLRIDPAQASAHASLGMSLQAQGRSAEAVSEFESALKQDGTVFDDRPAARAVYEAARGGSAWP
jgi:tetratricopeptide (TPR) repeat protein